MMKMRRIKQKKSRRGGFTLLEVLVVMVIMGILMSYVGPKVFGRVGQARAQKVFADFRTMETALTIYRFDNYQYPSSLKHLVERPDSGAQRWKGDGYLDRLPKDPWGNNYHYKIPGEHGDYDIYTWGSDNRIGGEGEASDIGNWQSP